jgi:hypothetical protein
VSAVVRLAIEAAEAVRAYRFAVRVPGRVSAAALQRYEEARAAVQLLAGHLEATRPEKAAHLYAETAALEDGSCLLADLERWLRSLADEAPTTEPEEVARG